MVVIIEDDEVAGRLLVKMLEEYFPDKKNIWLRSLADTSSFFSKHHLSESDLVMLDLYLSDGTAWEILDKIKNGKIWFPGRVVLMPGLKPNYEEQKLIGEYKPFKVIVKPLTLNDLHKLLN